MKDLHKFAREIERAIGVKNRLACHKFLHAIVKRATRFGFGYEDAKEIAHETLSIVLLIAQKEELRSLKALAHTISRNICIKRVKKKARLKHGQNIPHDPLEQVSYKLSEAEHRCNPLEILKLREKAELVKKCIETFNNQEYQQVFALVMEDCPRHEISRQLNISVKRVDAILNYGRKKIRAYMRKMHV